MRTDRTFKEDTKFEEKLEKEVKEKFRVKVQVRIDAKMEGVEDYDEAYIGALWFLDEVENKKKEQVISYIGKKLAEYLNLKDDEFWTETVVTPDNIERIDYKIE